MRPRAPSPEPAQIESENAAPSANDRVGACLVARLRELDGRLAEVAPRVLAHESDDEAVHDLRVAMRRTRTALEIGREVLGPFHADEVRRALRDVQRATGALRDEEVLLALLGSLGVEGADVAAWLEGRRQRERRLRRALVRLLQSGALDGGRRLLSALLAFRIKPSRDKRVHKYARRAVERARREVDRRRGPRPDDAEALHNLRIAYKRLRYTVETFADVLPEDVAVLAQGAARMQSRLGDLHDVDVAIACVRRARALTQESRADLLAALDRQRAVRVTAYVRLAGDGREARAASLIVAPELRATQPVGVVSLRKISTR
ncbi:MAG TPA: CHAD domain-containing protein [Polyangiaceae bacterium]